MFAENIVVAILSTHLKGNEFIALPLRQRKAAVLRGRLLDALLARLAQHPLALVNVRECCSEVGVSEPTFFNYFGSKTGALVHYVGLWSIETQWHVERSGSAYEGLTAMFERTAVAVRAVPWLMPEIIQFQFRTASPEASRMKPPPPPPTIADKLLRFAPLTGVDTIEPRGVRLIIRDLLERGVAQGELDPKADRALAEQLLISLFFGASASTPDPDVVADTMTRGLDVLWPRFAVS